MKDHPLTPMRDCNLKRLMEAQSRYSCVETGNEWESPAAKQGRTKPYYVIPDCRTDQDAEKIIQAFGEWKLLTGGSGLAKPLARFLLQISEKERHIKLHPLILAGSCSVATRNQIAEFQKEGGISIRITPAQLCDDNWNMEQLWKKTEGLLESEPVLVYSSASPEEVERDRERYGDVSGKLEQVMAELAERAASKNVPGIVAAGGETSGAVTKALHQEAFWIGESIAPGVPVMIPAENEKLRLILKSGNFGGKDFFEQALSAIEEGNVWKKN